MKRVLLTGASGFIGFHLVRRLHEEHCEIRCLIRKESRTDLIAPFRPEFYRGNLADSESLHRAVEGCEVVFHLAGRVRARSYEAFLKSNRDGTVHLARAAAHATAPPVFVYVSSLGAMGPSGNRVLQETDTPTPVSFYGKSKLAAEQELARFADRLPCSIVRPAIVFGEADRMNLEIFKTIQKTGLNPNPGWCDRIYSWIHAADLAELLVLVAGAGERLPSETDAAPGRGIYLAAADDGMKFSEVGRRFGQALGRKRTLALRCPPLAVLSVSSFYEFRKRCTDRDQPYDWDKAAESMHHWRCSPEKAKRQFGFDPPPFSDRARQTVDWYRENGWL